MQYQLKILEELVEFKLSPKKLEFSITTEVLEEVLSCAQSEQIRIKQAILKIINIQNDEVGNKCFIQKHQRGLISMLDAIMKFIDVSFVEIKNNRIDTPKELIGVQKAVYIIIEDILNFIGNRYFKYCDLGTRIPEKYKYLCLKEWETVITEIEKSTLLLNHRLIEIGLGPIRKYLVNKKLVLTYSRVLYYKELLRVIVDVLKVENEEKFDKELIKALVFVNFNSINFAQYCIKIIKSELEIRTKIVEKLEWLAWCLKKINQTPIRGSMVLVKDNPSIKELITQWILEEICFLEKKYQLQAQLERNENFITDTNIKIVTDLSVAQLACFIRLLVEIGAIKNRNKDEMIRFYSDFFMSKQSENVAFGSFRSKYYGINESSKEYIKEMIIKMLNELRKL